jgi:hypothetical protein
MLSGKVAPSFSITPRRNPCERPSVAPGFIALKTSG